MTTRILVGDCLEVLRTLPAESVHMCVTSPPYYQLRDYDTKPLVWGGDVNHAHEWTNERWYAAQGNASSSAAAFSEAGPENAARLKAARWHDNNHCHCGAWLGSLGLEPTPALFIAHLVEVFREVWRVLRPDATCWINIGDSYAGSGNGAHDYRDRAASASLSLNPEKYRGQKPLQRVGPQEHTEGAGRVQGYRPKSLMMLPARLAIALQEDGWIVRSDIAWCKRSCMPESVQDRPTSAWEHVFLLSKQARYYYDANAVRETGVWDGQSGHRAGPRVVPGRPGPPDMGLAAIEPGSRNQRNYWLLGPEPFSEWTEISRQVPVALDAIDGDTKRTTSPTCEVHASEDRVRSSDPDGGHAGVSGERRRSPDTGDRHDRALPFDFSSTLPTGDAGSSPQSSDSRPLRYASAANDRSNGIHKTDHAPATSPPYTPSAQIDDRTLHTSESPGSVGSGGRISVSNTAADSASDEQRSGPVERIESRIEGTCTCSYYREYTENTSHFAVFPSEIPRRAILAGTSEAGCCPECGAPWVRVTEAEHENRSNAGRAAAKSGVITLEGKGHPSSQVREGHDVRLGPSTSTTTTGWRASCTHTGAPVPATVLDCFFGAGTTGLVADRLRRDCIGIEINRAYSEMARRRIDNESPMFAEVSVA